MMLDLLFAWRIDASVCTRSSSLLYEIQISDLALSAGC